MLDELVSYIDAEGGVAYSSQLKGAGLNCAPKLGRFKW